MGIECYEGTLGGGKSYHAVQHALRYLAHGGRIYSNITLDRDGCEQFCRDRYGVELNWEEQYRYLTPSDIASLHTVVRGGGPDLRVLCILDEIHLYHNARDWSQASRGLLQWLTQCRKLYIDIICITQHRNNLDKQWVRLVGQFWRFKDLRGARMPGLGIPYPFFQCLAVRIDTDGKTVVDRRWERFDLQVFKCYKSDQLFEGCCDFAESGLGKVQLQKSKGKKKVKVYVMIGVLVFALLGVGWMFWKHNPSKMFRPSSSRNADSRPVPPPTLPREPAPLPASSSALAAPAIPDFVEADGWQACRGDIVSGYSSRYRLLFRGPPDYIEDGRAMYASRRGIVAF